jgi:hypothetical protein
MRRRKSHITTPNSRIPIALLGCGIWILGFGISSAQEYVEFKSMQDRFSIVFPAQPKVTDTTYTSEFKSVLPSRIYSVDQGQSHFKVTVVDYNNIQAIATEKAKACPPGSEACSGTATEASSTGAGYWKPDIEGAVIHATWELMSRPNEKAVYLGWANMNLVEGHMVNLVNDKDKSRTSAAIYMHENKLYIIEGTVPAGYPVPDFFQQSVGWLDENGRDIRYLTIYHNGFPKPAVRTQGGGGQPGGQGAGGNAGGRGGRGNQ